MNFDATKTTFLQAVRNKVSWPQIEDLQALIFGAQKFLIFEGFIIYFNIHFLVIIYSLIISF